MADEPGGTPHMDNDTNIAPRILIAVDDPDLRRISVAGLRSAGFSVSAPTDGEAAIMLAESFSPDVLIVCSRLRSPDGRPLFERLRDSSEQYLLCITEEGAHRTRAAMLHSGADDAVSSPVSPEELAARCHALLRRPRQMHNRVDSVPTKKLRDHRLPDVARLVNDVRQTLGLRHGPQIQRNESVDVSSVVGQLRDQL